MTGYQEDLSSLHGTPYTFCFFVFHSLSFFLICRMWHPPLYAFTLRQYNCSLFFQKERSENFNSSMVFCCAVDLLLEYCSTTNYHCAESVICYVEEIRFRVR